MGYLLSWHVSKICWYKDKSAFFEKAISKPKSSTWHSHSTQIPFWSDEHTRNLKTVRRNKCCNNLKGGGKPTRHAELLFSTYWLDFFFSWSCWIGFLSFLSLPAGEWNEPRWKEKSMALNPVVWIEVGLRLCLDFVPAFSQENLIHFKKYSFISLFYAYWVMFGPNYCLAQWRKVLFFINAHNLISVCGYIIFYFLFISISAHPY